METDNLYNRFLKVTYISSNGSSICDSKGVFLRVGTSVTLFKLINYLLVAINTYFDILACKSERYFP